MGQILSSINYEVTAIQKIMTSKSYSFFDGRYPYNLNIVGIRSWETNANKFDDLIVVIYRDVSLNWNVEKFKCTTDPGTYWLKNPMRKEGTAVLVPGQYKGAYDIGKHRGKYYALIQIGKVKVFRDNDRDNIIDADPDSVMEGYFGINIHRASSWQDVKAVDKWSAGCQVFQDSYEFKRFMTIVEKQKQLYPSWKFSYTLLEEKDFITNQ